MSESATPDKSTTRLSRLRYGDPHDFRHAVAAFLPYAFVPAFLTRP
jgi:hypothetical protein